jgi:hypothetical protein
MRALRSTVGSHVSTLPANLLQLVADLSQPYGFMCGAVAVRELQSTISAYDKP